MAVRYKTAAKKTPNPIDEHTGRRPRMRRRTLAMSQAKLGDAPTASERAGCSKSSRFCRCR